MGLQHYVTNQDDAKIRKLLAEGVKPEDIPASFAGEIRPDVVVTWAKGLVAASEKKPVPTKK